MYVKGVGTSAMYVIDASVWVSWFMPDDAHHALARQWIDGALERESEIFAPGILLPEVAGALSRITGDPEFATQMVARLVQTTNLRVIEHDARSYIAASELAADLRIRGSDAMYTLVAVERRAMLISLDSQQVERSRSVVTAARPSDAIAN